MVKITCLLRRPEGVSREDFWSWWDNDHKAMVRTFPGLRKYVINWREDSEYFDNPDSELWDGFAELWFDDAAAARAAYDSEEAAGATADTRAHVGIVVRMLITEQEVEPTPLAK